MIFSSITFLLLFLPITIILYYCGGHYCRNIVLLVASLFFYTWGEGIYVLLMLFSIGVNYCIGILIERDETKNKKRAYLAIGIAVNLLLLSFFKYTNWIIDTISPILPPAYFPEISLTQIHLPIGISFFTFQALSYIIDIYRLQAKAQKNPLLLGLYIALFPQLIAGPIVRYSQIAKQIIDRQHSFALFASGVERFTFGLAKKVIIANSVAELADTIFATNYTYLYPEIAWLGIICYTLQIYFDFSGYSDMAIGLGKIFGFDFPENFNYPYISGSIQEFWQRWHITLSSWFRDYLYIPLGGSRVGLAKTYRNLLIVFLLCGLWHGASWNYIVWGCIHGFFLILERTILKKFITNNSLLIFRHIYTLFIVIHAWIFFRVENMPQAIVYIKSMYGIASIPDHFLRVSIYQEIQPIFIFSLCLGIIFSTPIFHISTRILPRFTSNDNKILTGILSTTKPIIIFLLLYVSLSFLAVHSYNPFIYFRF